MTTFSAGRSKGKPMAAMVSIRLGRLASVLPVVRMVSTIRSLMSGCIKVLLLSYNASRKRSTLLKPDVPSSVLTPVAFWVISNFVFHHIWYNSPDFTGCIRGIPIAPLNQMDVGVEYRVTG
jgi:hypothetical protein